MLPKLSRLAPPILLLLCSGCTTTAADGIAGVGWSFNFGDWTCSPTEAASNPACGDAFRECDNQPRDPAGSPISAEPPYEEIMGVRVFASPVPPVSPPHDLTFGCALGREGGRIPLTGLQPGFYDILIQALLPDGTVAYSHEEPNLDLNTYSESEFELRVAMGELAFFPVFTGSSIGQCPNDAETVSYRLFANDSAAELEGEILCSSGAVEQLIIRNIPVAPIPGANGTFIPTTYRIELEGRNASGATTYCGVDPSRAVRPGNNSTRQNQELAPANSCP